MGKKTSVLSTDWETKLKETVSETFDLAIEQIGDELAREVTKEWDSFNHLLLVSNLESAFGISFTMAEVEKTSTLRELRALIAMKATSAGARPSA